MTLPVLVSTIVMCQTMRSLRGKKFVRVQAVLAQRPQTLSFLLAVTVSTKNETLRAPLPGQGLVGPGTVWPYGSGGVSAAAAAAARASAAIPVTKSVSFFISSPPWSVSSSLDGERPDHPGAGVARDRAKERKLAGFREAHRERLALTRVEVLRPLASDPEVVRDLAVVHDFEDDRPAGDNRRAELEAHLEHRHGHVRRLGRRRR